MSRDSISPSPLAPYRVLDLTNEKGWLCGKIFADLGADVIKVEPPEGDPARRKGPFFGDDPDPEKSLFWMAYNTGKRGIALNPDDPEDQAKLRGLIETTDFLIESFSPGKMKRLSMDYPDLEKINPGLIMASISPFGQTGPRARWKGPDIVPWAMSGYMWMTGEADKAPLRISQPTQAYLHAGAMAAVGCLMAHHYRAMTGLGQHVDISAQQCPSWMLTNTYAYWDLMQKNLSRAGVKRHFGESHIKTLWKALDGYISFMFSGGVIGAKGQRRVVELMDKDGMAGDWLKAIDWDEIDAFSSNNSEKHLDRITDAFSRFFETKTRAELFEEAVDSGIMLAPVNTVAEVAGHPQLEARDFWTSIMHPHLGQSIRFPGPPVRMSETPWRIEAPAPLMGEHNGQVFSEKQIEQRSYEGKSESGRFQDSQSAEIRPLAGLRVLDLTNTVLGPTTTRYLSDHGATVVKIETMTRPETTRIASPFSGGEPDVNQSGYFATHNAGKLSVTLNMKMPGAKSVLEKLICWSDVLIESFAPGVMERWGFSYGDVKKINPVIIMASTCLEGQTGPYSAHRGYGQSVSAMAGWFELTGWPDGEPIGPYSAYSDFIDWSYLLVSILTALDYRQRTGLGQYIDQSQFESALHFLSPAILDYESNHRVATRIGNRNPYAAPHGAYRCSGEDRWCVIAATTEEEWERFCRIVDNPALSAEDRFRTLSGRKQHEDELDRHIETWTIAHRAEDVMEKLQAAGVPAGVVQNAEDLFGDPQLNHRGHFASLDHPEMGRYHIATSVFHLSRCDNAPRTPAPLMGEHNERVLKEFLKLDDDEIEALIEQGALE